MPFVKGQKANPFGRPKGTKNKAKAPIKDRLEGLLEKTYPIIERELESATPEDRRAWFLDIANLVLPYKEHPESDNHLKTGSQC
jgi:hypothetical protein